MALSRTSGLPPLWSLMFDLLVLMVDFAFSTTPKAGPERASALGSYFPPLGFAGTSRVIAPVIFPCFALISIATGANCLASFPVLNSMDTWSS